MSEESTGAVFGPFNLKLPEGKSEESAGALFGSSISNCLKARVKNRLAHCLALQSRTA